MKKVIKKIMSDIKSLRNSLSGKTDKEITLSKEELEFLLQLIAKSNFEGRDVQIVYETAVKLQTLIQSD